MPLFRSLADQVDSCRCLQADPAAAARVLPALSTPVLQVCMSGGAARTARLLCVPALLPPNLELQEHGRNSLTLGCKHGSYRA